MARNKDGTIRGGSNERVFFVVVVVIVVVFPPQHNHHFQADWLYNIPRGRLSVLFHPFCGSADYKQSGRLRASGRTALRESLMRSRFKLWPFLKLLWISEISSGISHGDTNDQRSELAPVLIISRGGERRVVYIIKGLCLMNKRRAQKLDGFDLRWCLGRNGCPNYGKCTAKCQHMHMQ